MLFDRSFYPKRLTVDPGEKAPWRYVGLRALRKGPTAMEILLWLQWGLNHWPYWLTLPWTSPCLHSCGRFLTRILFLSLAGAETRASLWGGAAPGSSCLLSLPPYTPLPIMRPPPPHFASSGQECSQNFRGPRPTRWQHRRVIEETIIFSSLLY